MTTTITTIITAFVTLGNDVKDAPLNGAPYVLFDPSVPHGDGAVVSTFDEHFTSGCYLSGDSCGCGVSLH